MGETTGVEIFFIGILIVAVLWVLFGNGSKPGPGPGPGPDPNPYPDPGLIPVPEIISVSPSSVSIGGPNPSFDIKISPDYYDALLDYLTKNKFTSSGKLFLELGTALDGGTNLGTSECEWGVGMNDGEDPYIATLDTYEIPTLSVGKTIYGHLYYVEGDKEEVPLFYYEKIAKIVI